MYIYLLSSRPFAFLWPITGIAENWIRKFLWSWLNSHWTNHLLKIFPFKFLQCRFVVFRYSTRCSSVIIIGLSRSPCNSCLRHNSPFELSNFLVSQEFSDCKFTESFNVPPLNQSMQYFSDLKSQDSGLWASRAQCGLSRYCLEPVETSLKK